MCTGGSQSEMGSFELQPQTTSTNCSGTALCNAFRYLRRINPMRAQLLGPERSPEQWQSIVEGCDPFAQRNAAMAATWIAAYYPLEVLHVSAVAGPDAPYDLLDHRLRRVLGRGWSVLMMAISSDYVPGGRHAVAVVPPAYTVLDGKADHILHWTGKELLAHRPDCIMAMRMYPDAWPGRNNL